MNYDLQYDPEHHVLLVIMGRAVTEASALAAYQAVQRFIAAYGPCSEIADLSAVESAHVSGHFVQSLAWMPSSVADGRRLILVAPKTWIYGLSRMFHLWRDETAQYEIVRTLSAAYALLALEIPDFRAVTDCPR